MDENELILSVHGLIEAIVEARRTDTARARDLLIEMVDIAADERFADGLP